MFTYLFFFRHLDISQSSEIQGRSNEKNGIYDRPNHTLAALVESLPFLKCLDISGTNLAGTGVAEQKPNGNLATDIPGLRSRISNPLEMLGLYGTSHEACHRHHIPALRVTGDATEEQILAAGKVQHLSNLCSLQFKFIRVQYCSLLIFNFHLGLHR